jgi:ankyrin repeat protein
LTASQIAALKPDYDLFQAAYAGDTPRVRALLKKGAHVNAADWQYGFTPLMWAAKKGNLGAVRYLLAHGAKVNMRSKPGVRVIFDDSVKTKDLGNGMMYQTALVANQGDLGALDIAAASGWGMTARELIAHGADVNATDPEGSTAIMAAAYHNDLATIKAMLAHGANVNAVDHFGRGALWIAAWRVNEIVTRELLARGAKPAPDVNGVWPSDAARLMGYKNVVALLARPERLAKATKPKANAIAGNTAGTGGPMADKAMTRPSLSGNGGIIILN